MSELKHLLTLDCGTLTTTALLIAPVNGTYRLVGRGQSISTYGSPWSDLSIGAIDAIRQVEAQTALTLLDENGALNLNDQPGGSGLDMVTATISAASPLNVVLVGLTAEISLEAARQALQQTYAQCRAELSLNHQSAQERVTNIKNTSTDVILLVGGVEHGGSQPVIDLAHSIALGLYMQVPGQRPSVLYAGNTDLRKDIAAVLEDITELQAVDNLQPHLGQTRMTAVADTLESLYLKQRLAYLPGLSQLSSWTQGQIQTAATGFANSIAYLGQSYQINVLGLDLGSAHTILAMNRGKRRYKTVLANQGLAQGLPPLLEQSGLPALQRWLPFETDDDHLQNVLQQKSVMPQTVPPSYRGVLLEMAAMREIMRRAATQARPNWSKNPRQRWFQWDLIIGAGGVLTRLQNPGLAALALIDGLEPVGICSLALDTGGMLNSLGGLAVVAPDAAAQVIAFDALRHLGVVVAPLGIGSPRDKALRVKVKYDDDRGTRETHVPFGQLEILPLGPGETAQIDVYPGRKFDLQPHGLTQGKGVTATVEGGQVGIIIDTRGRPLMLAQDVIERRHQLAGWLLKLGLAPDLFMSEDELANLSGLFDAA